jgi:hypothetical protein
VVLAVLADDGACVAEHHGGVVASVAVDDVALIHRGNNDHVVLAGLARDKRAASGRQISNFGELVPGLNQSKLRGSGKENIRHASS